MFCGRPGCLLSECERINGGGDSVDIDRARPSRVLESQDNQSVCVEYRSSLAGVTSPDTVICWRVLSGALSAQPIALRVRERRRVRNYAIMIEKLGGEGFEPPTLSV